MSRSLTSGRSVPQLEGPKDVLRGLSLTPKRLQEYLIGARLLSFISDKNLGIVVVTRDWYETEVNQFLDLPVFRPFFGNFQEFQKGEFLIAFLKYLKTALFETGRDEMVTNCNCAT